MGFDILDSLLVGWFTCHADVAPKTDNRDGASNDFTENGATNEDNLMEWVGVQFMRAIRLVRNSSCRGCCVKLPGGHRHPGARPVENDYLLNRLFLIRWPRARTPQLVGKRVYYAGGNPLRPEAAPPPTRCERAK